MSARVIVLSGPLCGETLSIQGIEATIGRDAGVTLSIPDHLMSRRHCTVEGDGGRFTLRDLGSSNGTFVNGIPVRERTLAHGDRIRAGETVLLFLAAEEAERPAPAGPAPLDGHTARLPRGAGPTRDGAGMDVSCTSSPPSHG